MRSAARDGWVFVWAMGTGAFGEGFWVLVGWWALRRLWWVLRWFCRAAEVVAGVQQPGGALVGCKGGCRRAAAWLSWGSCWVGARFGSETHCQLGNLLAWVTNSAIFKMWVEMNGAKQKKGSDE